MKLCFALLLLSLVSSTSLAQQLYRFQVEGKTVIKDHIPQEYSGIGYDVLNLQGRVVETVAPALTAEQLAAQAEQAERDQLRAAQREQRKQQDQTLLQLYFQPQDVKRAYQQRINDLQASIPLQQRRLEELAEKLQQAQNQAANFERRSQALPQNLALEISQLQNTMLQVENSIQERHKDIERLEIESYESYQRRRILELYAPGTLEDEIDYHSLESQLANQTKP